MSLLASIKSILCTTTTDMAARAPSKQSIKRMRRWCEMQLHADEMLAITAAVLATPNCNFLVFGLGRDSLFWSRMNHMGRTVFLEDNADWFDIVAKKHPELEASLIRYTTVARDWRSYLDAPKQLEMQMPLDIDKQKWDVVFVDAPAGYDDASPGRTQSIYLASRLVREGGTIFVHDCHREIERESSLHFLGEENLDLDMGTLRRFKTHKSTSAPRALESTPAQHS